MKHILTILTILTALLLAPLAALTAADVPKPNILVILADDAGYADFGFQGGGINSDFAALTPHIDSLASGGVRFSSGYVSGPVCSPSRAGLMIGRYQHRYGCAPKSLSWMMSCHWIAQSSSPQARTGQSCSRRWLGRKSY